MLRFDAVEGNVYQSIRVDSLPDTDDKVNFIIRSYDGQMTFETSDVKHLFSFHQQKTI